MISRFHCPFPLSPGAIVDLPPEAAHHAMRVLRLDIGDTIQLFDGRGGEWSGRLLTVGKTVAVALEFFDEVDREPPLSVTVAQALPAADKMDWILQKGVELGAAAYRPIVARRSVVRLSGERLTRRVEHWRNVVVASCEQCRRNRVPTVAEPVDLPRFLGEAPAQNDIRLILAPGADLRLAELPRPTGRVTLLIGPEGGFEESELVAAELAGFRAVSLGPRVLRTETAAAAALAAMMTLWGDF
jgi:16S rRNA (uracil1498-N3)-methyltransferase